eukprot:GHVP01031539.1.p1 GENE.GHVP01031539.1~~GHVP01031539.1.p1  ORF type:complete len:127 (+),score=25.35 GHVP01031539.1:32-412(+)
MSWQEYVDDSMVGSGSLLFGIISGHEGDIWASSEDFKPTKDELINIFNAFEDSCRIQTQGIFLQGSKYFALKCDGRSIYGKAGDKGCICVKTEIAILIGIYNKDMIAGDAAKTVEELADFLIDQGY